MFYLFSGYLFVQLFSLTHLFNKASISLTAVFFSIIVFVIWSFIPVIGYVLAQFLGANSKMKNSSLLFYGLVVGLIETSLFYFDILTKQGSGAGTILVFSLFFFVAFIPAKRTIA